MTTILSINLLGDSILDNASYVDSGEAVIDQIRKLSPIPVSLLAVDDDTTADTLRILDEMGDDPKPEKGAVVSVGGNDALQNSSILMATCTSVFDAFSKTQPILDAFRGCYIAVLKRQLQIYDRENLRVCTIYNKIPLGPTMPREALTALGL